jgi:hypothetical protein
MSMPRQHRRHSPMTALQERLLIGLFLMAGGLVQVLALTTSH